MKTVLIALLAMMLVSCGMSDLKKTSSTAAVTSADPGSTDPGVRLIFHKDNFTWLDTFNTNATTGVSTTDYSCVGDNVKVHQVSGSDYTSTATAFTTKSGDDLNPTYRPAFLRHVSVDITNSYYADSTTSTVSSDSCSYRGTASAALPSYCADFDRSPLSVATPTPAPAIASTTPTPAPTPDWSADSERDPFFGTGYYRVRDDWCAYQGPIVSVDETVTKTHIGGASIDLDRAQLGSSEDVLLNITYQAFNSEYYANQWPNMNLMATPISHHTVLKVQMIGTGQTLDTLMGVPQPRAWGYYESSSAPVYAKDITTLEDPYSGLRTEQVYVPLSKYPLVDRIRIERVRGSYILYEVDVYRMGERSASLN